MEVEDPMTEEDLTRNKFGDEYAHDEIPDAASIKAAKEKRAKAAASGAAAGGGLSEDFISLGGCSKKGSRATRDSESNYQGPHPESRLQREEDDLGSGEDEFDQYTGASERIGLGKKAEKERERRRKQNIREAMGDEEGGQEAEHGTNGTLKQDEMDEEEREWERSQMDRWSLPGERQRREGREKSPYTPAPIPHTAPLPTLTSTSARLSARLAQLNESAEAHSNVVHDAELSLKQMDEEETANKEQVQREGEKEAWFREFEEWAISVAGFLDEKVSSASRYSDSLHFSTDNNLYISFSLLFISFLHWKSLSRTSYSCSPSERLSRRSQDARKQKTSFLYSSVSLAYHCFLPSRG